MQPRTGAGFCADQAFLLQNRGLSRIARSARILD
jgi:hypothetical protein